LLLLQRYLDCPAINRRSAERPSAAACLAVMSAASMPSAHEGLSLVAEIVGFVVMARSSVYRNRPFAIAAYWARMTGASTVWWRRRNRFAFFLSRVATSEEEATIEGFQV
jgi:hypothetical protein